MIGAGYTAYKLFRSGRRLTSAASAFAAAPSVNTSWSLAGSVVGVIGPDKVINAIIRYGANLATEAGSLDASAANEMVELMKSRAPRDTSRLYEGIEAVEADGGWIVRAHAQRDDGSADYARMVEFGTSAGQRGRRVATDDYFAGPYSGRRGSLNEDTGRRRRAADARRRVNRTHPGTPAQPYFVNSAHDVLDPRGEAMQGLSDAVAAGEDLL